MKKFKKHKQSAQPDSTSSVVISESFEKSSYIAGMRRRSKLLVILCVGLTLLIGLMLWYVNSREQEPPKKQLDSNVDTDYESTPTETIPTLLMYDYDTTVEELEKADLSKKLKSFEMAHNVGMALYRLDKKSKSLEAYKIAVNKAPGDLSGSFYKEVCGIAYGASDLGYGDKMCDLAIEKFKVSVIPEGDKAGLIYGVERSKLHARQPDE